MKNPYLNNLVAKGIFEGYYTKLFENEKVDSLANKLSDSALNVFKVLTFDLAPKRDRNPDVIRIKLSDISNSNSVKQLAAKLLDYADDNELVDVKYAEAKRLYLECLKKLCDCLERIAEISSEKGEVIIKAFKISPIKLQNIIDNIAKQAEEETKLKVANEADLLDYYDDINESFLTGYKGRIEKIKKLLTNLITSSEGKDQKNGYGRDWKRTFIDLDEKRKVLDITRSGFGEKDKNLLDELEKQVIKYQKEFNDALLQAANRSLQALEDDEDVYKLYSDVTELAIEALDLLTRAKSQYEIAYKQILDQHEVEESTFIKSLFPLKRGDRDTNSKIKGSNLIYSIQLALCHGIPSADKLIKSKKGPNGIYGPATTAVIASLQKLSGNKNLNGQLDRALLDSILASDWVQVKDKKAIESALEMVRSKTNESEFYGVQDNVVSIDCFLSLNENKIVINNAEFERELASQYKIAYSAPTPEYSPKGSPGSSKKKSGASVNELTKKLRTVYGVKVESDDFIKTDGTLKSSYSPEFISAWTKAIDETEGSPKDYGYFFYDSGIYPIKTKYSSLKTPSNWKKWSSVRQTKSFDSEDASDFLSDYMKTWNSFGRVKGDVRYQSIKSIIKEREGSDLETAYELMSSSILNKSIPYIDFEDLKGNITKAFNIALQKEEKSPDLGAADFCAVNDFLIMVSSAVSFDGSKFISCIKWIHDHVLGEVTAKRISNDSIILIMTGKGFSGISNILSYSSNGIVPRDVTTASNIKSLINLVSKMILKEPSKNLGGFKYLIDAESDGDLGKSTLSFNCKYITCEIYPLINSHVKRMNANSFADIPESKSFKCVDVN
jgi:hypothetical protein